MAVTFTGRERLGPTTWRLEWESTEEDPTFYLYLDGVLIDVTTRTWKQLEVAVGEQAQLEVLDDPDAAPMPAYPSRALITWQPVAGAARYRVRELVGAQWVTRRTLVDNGESWFSFVSRVLEDMTAHEFRVVPVGSNGVDGLGRHFRVEMVRRPDAPAVAYSYADGEITAAAAG